MQANEPLSLFGVLNKSLMDELMTGLEVVANVKGRNRVRDLFMRLDEKYFRRWFMRDPETYDEKLIKVYEKIALKLHNAQMQPQRRMSVLADLPETLRQRYLVAEAQALALKPTWSDLSLVHSDRSEPDLEEGGSVKDRAADFAQCMRSTRRPTLMPNDKRQVDFSDTLQEMMRARLMSQSHILPGPQSRGNRSAGETNLSYIKEDDEGEYD
ncbi:hypothetical protein FBUS_00673 [Fasciolopsis buskii]|uniref:Uncharacterized protein n=1 Tax=Fasciolopsis buskii TaxID=27845 RepID=A0A8E0RS33_9TREM|nr:hypothetical protein FBUS_00673 [Fasciolopsis buski]